MLLQLLLLKEQLVKYGRNLKDFKTKGVVAIATVSSISGGARGPTAD